MLNPCSPCVCPGTGCEHCYFGYRSEAEKHELMKHFLLMYERTDDVFFGRGFAERYIKSHPDWKEEAVGLTEKEEPKENRFASLAKDARELYRAFRNEGFTDTEAIELTKTYLGVAFQDQVYQNYARGQKTSKRELMERLNRYKEEHKEEEKS